jgi:hypothetical protein
MLGESAPRPVSPACLRVALDAHFTQPATPADAVAAAGIFTPSPGWRAENAVVLDHARDEYSAGSALLSSSM